MFGSLFYGVLMKYYYQKPAIYLSMYGETYFCAHPLYNRCTLFMLGENGLAVIQQRFNRTTKSTGWSELDPWLTDEIYLNTGFRSYFYENAGPPVEGLYPTVTVRQIMWALKMKPLPKEHWETSFDRRII